MKFLLTIVWMLPFMALHAQNMQVSGYAGYTIPATLKVNKGKYRLEPGLNCGIFISVMQPKMKIFNGDTHIEFQYNHQRSDLWYRQYNIDSNKPLGKTNVSTLMVGINTEITKTWFRPFAGVLVGATIVDPTGAPDQTRFTTSFMGGAKIALTKKFGLRMQAQLIMPHVFNDPDAGWEPAPGATSGVAPNSVVVYTDFSGGFYIRF